MAEQVMYVVRSWPRLSQTFVVNEILALERRGVELTVFALARSGETLVQPQVAQVRADVVHLDGRGVGRVRALVRDVATVSSRSPLGLARSCATWGCTSVSPERARAKTVSSTPRRSSARISLTTKVCESRGQLRTTYITCSAM